jgi:hypothetical protein
MKPWEGAEINKPVVDLGISQWSTMAEDWERAAGPLIAQVIEALAAAPWGGGAEGEAFKAAHFRDGGPTKMLTQCADLTEQIGDASGRLRTTIGNTLGTDADIERDLAAGQTREI